MSSQQTNSRLSAKAALRQVDTLSYAELTQAKLERLFTQFRRRLAQLASQKEFRFSEYTSVVGAFYTHLGRLLSERFRILTRSNYRKVGVETASVMTDLQRKSLLPLVESPINFSRLSRRKLRQPIRRPRTKAEKKRAAKQLLFPPLPKESVESIVFGRANGQSWLDRLASQSRLASPQNLASQIISGITQGETPTEIEQRILPLVDNVRSSAKRIARTESVRVAHETQMAAWDQMGDLVIGYQIHATMDDRTRSWHSLRDGTIYYKNPKEGQKGLYQMPRPPVEAEDPRERPPGTPQTSFNCRCYLTPVLSDPQLTPAQKAVFQTAEKKLVPDPVVYGEWWNNAPTNKKRLAVGSRKYQVISSKMDQVRWEHFLDPETGGILPLEQLQSEQPETIQKRAIEVQKLIAERKALIRREATLGSGV